MLKKVIDLLKSHNKKAILNTACGLCKQYGIRGLIKGIRNKLDGRPLLTGIALPTAQNMHSSDEYNRRGLEILKEQQNELTRDEQISQISKFKFQPKLSVLMPVYNAPIKWLEVAIDSLKKQSYTNWELCAVDDGSKDLRGESFFKSVQQSDSRIKFRRLDKNGGISKASNVALEMASGEFIVLMDQDDALTEDALFWVVKELNDYPNADVLYSDECKTLNTVKPSPCDFYFKPDWSPELLINHMYIGHLTVYRTSVVKRVGGFRSQYDFSQDYDLALRVTEETNAVRHIERVLYYWRMLPTSGASGGKDFARISNISALKDAYIRRGLNTVLSTEGYVNYGRLTLKDNPTVSVVIPSDSTETLKKCINGLIGEATAYKRLEIIPVTNSKTAEEIEEFFPYLSNLKICRYDKLYNFSDKCNAGAEIATGEYLAIYNDDVYPFSRDWIERLLEVLQYDGVGAVSPLMLYEDQSIQYAGMVCNVPGQVGTAFNSLPFAYCEQNPFNHFLMRDVSILSGACTVLKTELYKKIGGFDAINTPTGHSDVDLSFKILEQGLRCVYTPHAVLTHIGNHSWAEKGKQDKAQIYCLKRWGKYIGRDPYYTASMRQAYYFDQSLDYQMYVPEKQINAENPNARDILFVSHELSLTGAPILLRDVVSATINNGDFPVVISPVDGPLRQSYIDMGVTVIIDESVTKVSDLFYHFANDFDLVIVNTLVCTEAIRSLSGKLPPVFWWVHDGSEVIKAVRNNLPRKLGKNIHIYCGSEYSQRLLTEFGEDYDSEIFRCGVDDFASDNTEPLDLKDKLKFLMVGSLEERKAQDVLLKAIAALPEEYQEKAEFIIVGNPLQQHILHMIEEYAKQYPCIKYMKTMPREELLKIYPKAICAIVPSRDEPTSMIGIESMMFSRAIISSDKTGIGEFLHDGIDGYIFHSEDVEALTEKIKTAIDNPERMLEMGKKSRAVYEKNYLMSIFLERYHEITEQLMRKE